MIEKIGVIGGRNGIGKVFVDFFSQKFKGRKEILFSGRNTELTNKDIIDQCDLVIFSVPIAKTDAVIRENIEHARKGQIWMDFTSIKQTPVKAMLESVAEVCGAHPLFGPLPNVIGQKLVLCRERISNENWSEICKMFSDFEILETTAKKHDEIMGIIQNLSHFSDFVLGKTLKDANIDLEEILRFSSPPYRVKLDLLARIFAQNPELYADISSYNEEGRRFEKEFLKATEFFKEKIEEKDRKAISEEFKSIQDFLGHEFCAKNLQRSQKLLDYENSTIQRSESVPKIAAEVVVSSKWAIFGQEFSHTDEASLFFRKEDDSVIYFRNIFEIFNTVEAGNAEYGLVPYENSTKGSIFETLDELFDHKGLQVVGAYENDISQNLLGIPGSTISEIKTIVSHPQALAQSQKFLRKNAPDAQFSNRRSTVIASQEVVYDRDSKKASIGSKLLAEKLGLEILAKDMQVGENKTRFIVISKDKKLLLEKAEHTSFVFWFSGDESGNLAKFLTSLADRKINLTKLDSRRAGAEYGGYLFFVDAKVSPKEFEKSLPKLTNLCGGIRVLGHF